MIDENELMRFYQNAKKKLKEKSPHFDNSQLLKAIPEQIESDSASLMRIPRHADT